MIKKLLILTAFVSVAFAEMTVATTIFPLYDIVKNIGGDKVRLLNVIPFGIEAHEYEPKAKEMASLSQCDIFITSGLVFEPWSPKVVSALKIKDKTIDMSKKVKLIDMRHEGDSHNHGHMNQSGAYDPHYWLSIDNYMIMSKEIAQLLGKKDPVNASYYDANYAVYYNKLSSLKKEYETIKSCKRKRVIVNHNAFGYIANDYGIMQHSISGMSPDSKPSAKQISELIKLVKIEKINTVFFEEYASDKVARTIAREAGVKTDALRPIENISKDESIKGVGYLEIMKQNLLKLKGSMDCQ